MTEASTNCWSSRPVLDESVGAAAQNVNGCGPELEVVQEPGQSFTGDKGLIPENCS